MFHFTRKGAATGPPAEASPITADLISRPEIAEQLRVTPHTLRKWEITGRGPPTIRVGKRIFYRAAAVRSWLLEQEREPAKS